MKKSKKIILIIAPVLSTILFSACGSRDAATTRDVYQNKEDCQRDWGEEDLCEQMNEEDDREYRRGHGSGVMMMGRPFYGPAHYPGDRTVLYKGRTVSPSGKSTSMQPYNITSRSSASSRSSSVSSPRASSSSTSYSGFGGRSSGGGGS